MADPMMPAAGDADADPAADAGAAGPTVLCTVMLNADGSFGLTKGDEPEPGEVMGADAGQPQSFDGPGPLLKAVLDIVQNAQNTGEGSPDANFDAGYNGDSAPMAASPKAAGPAARY